MTPDPLELSMIHYVLKVYKSKLPTRQRWRWTLIAPNGKKVAASGEAYTDRNHAVAMGTKLFPLATQEIDSTS